MAIFRRLFFSAFAALCVATLCLSACSLDSRQYARIVTPYGDMRVLLYDETPQHRDNFIKLASEGYYDSLLFHRVIEGFMIQGGDPDSKGSPAGMPLGNGGPGYTLPAEIGAPHLRGTLAAARTSDAINPKRNSSGSQFYIVQGQVADPGYLDNIERSKGFKYNEAQRELYTTIGGTPQLDGDYTVFGEVVEGLEVIDKIAAVAVDRGNRPTEDVPMRVIVE